MFIITFIVISILFVGIDIFGPGGIDLSASIWMPTVGVLIMLFLSKLNWKTKYLFEFLVVFVLDLLYLRGELQGALIFSFISFYIYMNIYTLFLDIKSLKWPWLVYLNSLTAGLFMIITKEYDSAFHYFLFFIIAASSVYSYIKFRRTS